MTMELQRLATVIVLGALASLPLLERPGLSQDARAFSILKNLERRKQAEAMELLRASQRCVDAARNLHALQGCHRQERDREWEQRERFRRQIEAVRNRYGLRRPGEWPPDDGGWRSNRRPPPPPPE